MEKIKSIIAINCKAFITDGVVMPHASRSIIF